MHVHGELSAAAVVLDSMETCSFTSRYLASKASVKDFEELRFTALSPDSVAY